MFFDYYWLSTVGCQCVVRRLLVVACLVLSVVVGCCWLFVVGRLWLAVGSKLFVVFFVVIIVVDCCSVFSVVGCCWLVAGHRLCLWVVGCWLWLLVVF